MAQFVRAIVGLDVVREICETRPLMRLIQLQAGLPADGELSRRLVALEIAAKFHVGLILRFRALFCIKVDIAKVFMASDLVSQIEALPNVFGLLLNRLAEGHALFVARIILRHVKALDELLLVALQALSSRGTK